MLSRNVITPVGTAPPLLAATDARNTSVLPGRAEAGTPLSVVIVALRLVTGGLVEGGVVCGAVTVPTCSTPTGSSGP